MTREVVTVFKPSKDSKLGIGLVGAAGCVTVLSIAKDGLFSTTSLKVGMIVETINNVKCTDAGHGVSVLREAERQVTIVALHAEKAKKALKPSTYQNAKKRKAEESKPKKTPYKKQAVTKTKTATTKAAAASKTKTATTKVTVSKTKTVTAKAAASNKTKTAAVVPKKSSKHDFNHDDAYMHLLENGFPDPGCVSACQNYYVTKNNDSYISIAEKLGMDDWKQLAAMPFNQRFYGGQNNKKTKSLIFAARTVIKIPKTAASKWKLNKIVDNYQEVVKTLATCSKCLKKGELNDTFSVL